MPVTPRPMDVSTLIDEARNAFLRRGATNAVEVDIDPDLPLIAADRRRVTQVLDNLLSVSYSAGRVSISSTVIVLFPFASHVSVLRVIV